MRSECQRKCCTSRGGERHKNGNRFVIFLKGLLSDKHRIGFKGNPGHTSESGQSTDRLSGGHT